ncbi:MAG: 5,10-methylenetetrahydrofolate reductase, partial [uncultured Ramlibacter sp.]
DIPDQSRVLPAQDRRGRRQASRRAAAALFASPRVLLGDVRRRRVHPGRHPVRGQGDHGGRLRRGAAPVVHRPEPRKHPRKAGGLRGRRREADRGLARRPAEWLWAGRRVPLRQRPGRLHPQRDRPPVPAGSGRLPRGASAGEIGRCGHRRFPGQGRGGCRCRHHAVLLQCRRLSALPGRTDSTRRGGSGGARHHADHQLDPALALFRCVRRRDPALDPVAPAGVRRRRRVDQGVRPGRGGRPVRKAAHRRGAGAALLHDEPVGRDAGDLPAPGAL